MYRERHESTLEDRGMCTCAKRGAPLLLCSTVHDGSDRDSPNAHTVVFSQTPLATFHGSDGNKGAGMRSCCVTLVEVLVS